MGERRRCWRVPGSEDSLRCVYFTRSPLVSFFNIIFDERKGSGTGVGENRFFFSLSVLGIPPSPPLFARQPLPALGQYLITSVTEQHVVLTHINLCLCVTGSSVIH